MEAIYITAQYPEAKLVTVKEEEMLREMCRENSEYIELKPVHIDMIPKLVHPEESEEAYYYESFGEIDTYSEYPVYSEPESNSSSYVPTPVPTPTIQSPTPAPTVKEEASQVPPPQVTKVLPISEKKERKVLEKIFKCDTCTKMFSTNAKLKIHQRIHTGDKPFKCTECGKGFLTKHHLKMHGITHSGEKPYSCNICGKSFGRNYSLTVHKKAHLGLKPCKCNVCGKSFRQKVSLKAHMKTHNDKISL